MDYDQINVVLDNLGRMPGWIVVGYFWTKTLDLRHGRWFWALWVGLLVFNTGMHVVWYTRVSRAIADIFPLLVFPLLVSRGKLWYRLLVVLSTAAGTMIVEVMCALTYFALGHDPLNFRDVQAHPAYYYQTQAFITCCFALVFYVFYFFIKRFRREEADPVVLYFGGCLFGQVILACTMLAVSINVTGLTGGPWTACVVFVCALLVFNALALGYANWACAARARERRAQDLREQLDACIAHFRGVANESQALARFRHDLRDQLQGVSSLVEAGDFARAEALLGDLEEQLRQTAPSVPAPCKE